MVYITAIGQRTIHLAVSGMLWRSSLVMVDEETGSLWSHLLGQAMQGPLTGTQLTAIPADMVTWEAWQRQYPQTTVLNLPRTSTEYDQQFYQNPAAFVFGWIENGQAYSAGFDVLMENQVLNLQPGKTAVVVTFENESTAARLFDRVVDSRIMQFEATERGQMQDSQTHTTWNSRTGAAIDGPLKGTRLRQRVGTVSYAETWRIFHPQSRSVRRQSDGL